MSLGDSRRPAHKAWNMRFGLINNAFWLPAIAVLISFLLLFVPAGVVCAGQTAVITADDVHVRSGPGTGYRIIGLVNSGDVFSVLGKSGDWYRLQLSHGPGWVAGWLLQVKSNSGETGASDSLPGAGASAGAGAGSGGSNTAPFVEEDNSALPGANSGETSGRVSSPVVGGAPGTGLAAILTADEVNVRSGPGIGYRIIGQVNSGDIFPVLDKAGEWYKLQLSRGPGWVAGLLLRVAEASVLPGINPSRRDVQRPSSGAGESGSQIEGDGNGDESPAGTGSSAGGTSGNDNGNDNKEEGGGNDGASNTGGNGSGEDGNSTVNNEEKSFLQLKLGQKKDRTEITLISRKKFSYEVFSLSQPDRLVMDLRFDGSGDTAYAQPPSEVGIDKGPIKRLRSSWLDDDRNVLRIVFDLKQRVHYNVNVFDGGKAVVLEIFVPDFKKYLQGRKIFIDPGHGGRDPGAIGPSGLQEKDITLDIAKRAAELLEDQGARVRLSRARDDFVGLKERAEMANRFDAEIFVSVHINSNRSSGKSGISTYYYSPPADSPSRARDRRQLAWNIQTELSSTLKRPNLGLYRAEFVVLRYTTMPAVLLEIGFISNHEEEKLLKERGFREQAAQAIARGIGYYYAGRS